jgi:hypothetical protein
MSTYTMVEGYGLNNKLNCYLNNDTSERDFELAYVFGNILWMDRLYDTTISI